MPRTDATSTGPGAVTTRADGTLSGVAPQQAGTDTHSDGTADHGATPSPQTRTAESAPAGDARQDPAAAAVQGGAHEVTATDTDGVVPASLVTPAVGSAVSVNPAQATAPAAQSAPATPAPLAQQLARPLFTLQTAPHGEHVVTVTIAPEALGSVTVRAHVSATGMHVEMFAASDAGRDAVRAILPDLRRDLGQTGVSTSLDLSSQNQPSDTSARGDGDGTRQRQGGPVPADPRLASDPRSGPARTGRHPTEVRSTGGLDVLA